MTLHVGMLGIAGIVMLLFPFYSGPVGKLVKVRLSGYFYHIVCSPVPRDLFLWRGQWEVGGWE